MWWTLGASLLVSLGLTTALVLIIRSTKNAYADAHDAYAKLYEERKLNSKLSLNNQILSHGLAQKEFELVAERDVRKRTERQRDQLMDEALKSGSSTVVKLINQEIEALAKISKP